MDATPPGPPSGPPAAPPMDATPPGPPAGPPSSSPVDLLGPLDSPPGPPTPPPSPPVEDIPPPPGLETFPEPLPVEPSEPDFDDIDISEWDSNWEENWSDKATVFQPAEPEYVPESIQEDIDWNPGDPDVQVTKGQEPLPSKSALNKMKKGELVEFANARGVDSSGTKKDIIERLHS